MSSRPWLLSIFCALAFSAGAVPALADSFSTAGTYFCLLDGDSYETSGYVRAVLSKSGHGSVAVQLGDEALCVVGVWLDPIQGTFVVKPGGDADMGVELRIVWEPGGAPTVVGTVTDDGETVAVEARKTAAGAALIGQPSGRFTFELGGISGYGSVLIGRKGDVRGSLRLASGETIALGGALGADGTWPFFALAKNGTTLSGTVTFDENGEFDGMLRRRAPATATTAAVDFLVSIAGSAFDGTVGFGLADSHGAVAVEVGVYLQNEPGFEFSSRITRTGVFFQRDGGLRVLSLRFSPVTGFISGRVKSPAGATFTLFGAVLQGVGWANGFVAGGKGFFGIEDGMRFTGGSTTTTTTGGVVNIAGGQISGGGSLTLTAGATLTISNPGNFASGVLITNEQGEAVSLVSVLDGDFVLLGGHRFRVSRPAQGGAIQLVATPASLTTSGGAIVNAGTSLVKTGAGTLTVSGNNAYTGGATNVNGGTLQINSGSTLTLGGSSASLTTVTLLNPGTFQLDSGLTLTQSTSTTTLTGGTLTTGAGTLTLNGVNTYTGGILTVNDTFSTNAWNSLTVGSGATLTAGMATGNATLMLNSGVTNTWAAHDPAAATLWLNNVVSNPRDTVLANASNLRLTQGGGTLTLDLAVQRTLAALAVDTSFASGFHITRESGEIVTLDTVADGEIIFINGARYRATRPVDGPLTLLFAPL